MEQKASRPWINRPTNIHNLLVSINVQLGYAVQYITTRALNTIMYTHTCKRIFNIFVVDVESGQGPPLPPPPVEFEMRDQSPLSLQMHFVTCSGSEDIQKERERGFLHRGIQAQINVRPFYVCKARKDHISPSCTHVVTKNPGGGGTACPHCLDLSTPAILHFTSRLIRDLVVFEVDFCRCVFLLFSEARATGFSSSSTRPSLRSHHPSIHPPSVSLET